MNEVEGAKNLPYKQEDIDAEILDLVNALMVGDTIAGGLGYIFIQPRLFISASYFFPSK